MNELVKIKKIGHCCLYITISSSEDLEPVVVLTDPGAFSTDQNQVTDVNIVLITHEHSDHLHIDSLKEVLKNNPDATVITNSSVGALLDAEGIQYQILENGSAGVKGIQFDGYDAKHEEIFGEFGQVKNTAYFIGQRLFYPGDSYCIPPKPVDILALPVAGPWCKVPDFMKYALAVKPNHAFPVHDGMVMPERIGSSHSVPAKFLSEQGIRFVTLKAGEEAEF